MSAVYVVTSVGGRVQALGVWSSEEAAWNYLRERLTLRTAPRAEVESAAWEHRLCVPIMSVVLGPDALFDDEVWVVTSKGCTVVGCWSDEDAARDFIRVIVGMGTEEWPAVQATAEQQLIWGPECLPVQK